MKPGIDQRMIMLFGDSWARQSWSHVPQDLGTGYKHWAHSDVWVNNNVDDWLNHYFTQNLVVNFAEFGNTNDWIVRDLYHRLATVSNIPDRLDIVIFQTDPLRIFAPRQDYTDSSIVWPNFLEWCKDRDFDWHQQDLHQLLHHILGWFYRDINSFAESTKNLNSHVRIWLLGGVGRVHDQLMSAYNLSCIMPSITEHFGFAADSCLENRLSLSSFMKFWISALAGSQAQKLKQQWHDHDTALQAKEDFWISRPDIFAGRHLTSLGLKSVAHTIQSRLDQA